MSWGVSIVVGLLSGAIGALFGGISSALACEWQQVSSREGERAYMVLYGGLLGIVLGMVTGLVASRVLAAQPDPSLIKALGWSSGVLLGLSLFALTIAFASAPPAPPREKKSLAPTRPAEVEPPTVPQEDYGTQRMRELKALASDAPLGVWLNYSRGNEAPDVIDFAKRAIAARPALHHDLRALLDTPRCIEALLYLEEDIHGVPDDLGEGVRAALRQVPSLLRSTFDDPSGVRSDSGLYDVRIALAAADRFTTAARTFAPEVADIARSFESAPRVRRLSRGSRYVEEQIKQFDAERLLVAWNARQNRK